MIFQLFYIIAFCLAIVDPLAQSTVFAFLSVFYNVLGCLWHPPRVRSDSRPEYGCISAIELLEFIRPCVSVCLGLFVCLSRFSSDEFTSSSDNGN